MTTILTKFTDVEEGKTNITFVPNGVQYSNKKVFCVGRDRKGKIMLLTIKKHHVSTIFSSDFKTAVKAKHIEVSRVAAGHQKSPYALTAEASDTTTLSLAPACEKLPPLTVVLSAEKLKPKVSV